MKNIEVPNLYELDWYFDHYQSAMPKVAKIPVSYPEDIDVWFSEISEQIGCTIHSS